MFVDEQKLISFRRANKSGSKGGGGDVLRKQRKETHAGGNTSETVSPQCFAGLSLRVVILSPFRAEQLFIPPRSTRRRRTLAMLFNGNFPFIWHFMTQLWFYSKAIHGHDCVDASPHVCRDCKGARRSERMVQRNKAWVDDARAR